MVDSRKKKTISYAVFTSVLGAGETSDQSIFSDSFHLCLHVFDLVYIYSCFCFLSLINLFVFRWSIIAAQLPGRTDNDIKNYWNTRLKKKLLPAGKRKDSSMALQMMRGRSNSKDEKKDGGGFSASAIDRMQLHMQLQGFNNDTCFSFYNRPTAGAEAGTVVGGGVPSIVNASVHHHDQMELNTAVTTKTDEDGDDKNNIDQPLSTNNHHDFDDRYSLHAAGYSSSQASNIQKIEGLQYDDLSEFIFGLNSSSSSNRFLEVQEDKQEVVNQDLDFFREMEQESFLLDYNLGTTYIYD